MEVLGNCPCCLFLNPALHNSLSTVGDFCCRLDGLINRRCALHNCLCYTPITSAGDLTAAWMPFDIGSELSISSAR